MKKVSHSHSGFIDRDKPEEKSRSLRRWYAGWSNINSTFHEFEGKGRNLAEHNKKRDSLINFEWLRDFDKRSRKKCLSNHPHGTFTEGKHIHCSPSHTIRRKFLKAEFPLSQKMFSFSQNFYLRHSSVSSREGN